MNKAIFWDFDGTLSYPNKSFSTALYDALREEEYLIKRKDTIEFLDNAYSWKEPHIEYADKVNDLWWDCLYEKILRFCNDKGITDVHKICRRFKELLIDVKNYKLYDDSVEVLEKCIDMGYDNYIITNNYPDIISVLDKLDIKKFFKGFIVSSHIGYEKPRCEFFDYAKKIANNPKTSYVVGDNPIADIKGGKDAGFVTIAVHKCKESDADYYLEKLSDIFEILNLS